MGIHNFTDVFNPKSNIKSKDIKDCVLVIDGNLMLCRAALAAKSVYTLTDKNGNSTVYLNTLLNQIMMFLKGNNEMIWCFDNPGENSMKKQELERRAKIREDAEAKLEEADNEEDVDKLQKRAFKPSPIMFKSLQMVLRCLGIRWTTTPEGFESEHLCACIAKKLSTELDNVFVITADVDALLFGAPAILKKRNRSPVYDIFELNDVLAQQDITQEQLVRIGVTLGSDFAPKVAGIGPKTVVRRVKSGESLFDEKQEAAVIKFMMPCKMKKMVQHQRTKESMKDLRDWLVGELLFSPDRVEKWFRPIVKELDSVDKAPPVPTP